MTIKEQILDALKKARPYAMTLPALAEKANVRNQATVSARIRELRAEGWPITKEQVSQQVYYRMGPEVPKP